MYIEEQRVNNRQGNFEEAQGGIKSPTRYHDFIKLQKLRQCGIDVGRKKQITELRNRPQNSETGPQIYGGMMHQKAAITNQQERGRGIQ